MNNLLRQAVFTNSQHLPKSFATESQVSEKFKPLYQALKTHLLEQIVVQADETPLNVLKEGKQCYMWLYSSGAGSPEATLPGMKNIVFLHNQCYRSGASSVPQTDQKNKGGIPEQSSHRFRDSPDGHPFRFNPDTISDINQPFFH